MLWELPARGLLLVRSVNLSRNQKKSGASEPAAPLELGNEWWPPGLCYLHFTACCFSSRQRSSGRFLHRPLLWEIPAGANNPASSTNLECCCLLTCSNLLESLPTLPLCPGQATTCRLCHLWVLGPPPLYLCLHTFKIGPKTQELVTLPICEVPYSWLADSFFQTSPQKPQWVSSFPPHGTPCFSNSRVELAKGICRRWWAWLRPRDLIT